MGHLIIQHCLFFPICGQPPLPRQVNVLFKLIAFWCLNTPLKRMMVNTVLYTYHPAIIGLHKTHLTKETLCYMRYSWAGHIYHSTHTSHSRRVYACLYIKHWPCKKFSQLSMQMADTVCVSLLQTACNYMYTSSGVYPFSILHGSAKVAGVFWIEQTRCSFICYG